MNKTVRIIVIDGQGGKMGSMLVAGIKNAGIPCHLTAVGANSIASSIMLKAGADTVATGENPVVVSCRTADIIIGPVGIVLADSLHGEITPSMALAVGQSPAVKILLPVNNLCNTVIAGASNISYSALVADAIERCKAVVQSLDCVTPNLVE